MPPKFRTFTRRSWSIFAALVSLVGASLTAAQTPITVQVINDHGDLPDSAIYLLLQGQDVAPAALADGQLPYYPFSAAGIKATPVGTVTNTSGSLVTYPFTAGPASAPIRVTSAGTSIAMSFQPATIAPAGTSTWTISLPNASTAADSLRQPFAGTLPEGVTTIPGAANAGTCSNVAISGSQVGLASAESIPAGGCTIVVPVTAGAGSAASTLTAITSYLQTGGANVAPATAAIAIVPAPLSAVTMAFDPATIAVGDTATLTIALPNPTSGGAELVSDFVDSMPAAIVVSPLTNRGTCPAASVTATQIKVPAGTTLPPGGCTIIVTVTSIATAGPLSGLAPATTAAGEPLTIVSPYSGKTRPVYQFSMSSVSSGNLYFSYNTPVMVPPAPTVTARYRFQSLEFSYSQFIVSNGDLTSIDFYGIPLELQTFAPGDDLLRFPLDRVTYYTSTASLLRAFTAVNSNLRFAFMRTDGAPFDPATDSLGNFARIVGPNQLAAPGTSPIQWPASAPAGHVGTWPPPMGSPWPYPSFADYLDWLVATGYQFVESDNATISAYTYDYTGSIAGDRNAGYTITLIGASPADPAITLFLPPQAASNGGFDFLVYGIPQNCATLQVSGFTCTSANVQTLTNSVYGWIQADVMAALNFGY